MTDLDRSLELQELEAPRILRQSAHEGGKVVSPMQQPPLPSRRYPWYSCLLEAEWTSGSYCDRKETGSEHQGNSHLAERMLSGSQGRMCAMEVLFFSSGDICWTCSKSRSSLYLSRLKNQCVLNQIGLRSLTTSATFKTLWLSWASSRAQWKTSVTILSLAAYCLLS